MNFTRTGVILCTEFYEDCVNFYSNIMGLPILHSFDNESSILTCFDMGGNNYLMVEPGGKAIPTGKTIDDNPVWLRFNVEDVEVAADELKDRGLSRMYEKRYGGQWLISATLTEIYVHFEMKLRFETASWSGKRCSGKPVKPEELRNGIRGSTTAVYRATASLILGEFT